MRTNRLAARIAFAERFTFAVIEQPFYSALRRVADMPCPQVKKPADVTELPRPAPSLPDLPQAA